MQTLKTVGNLFTEIFGAIPYEQPRYTVLQKFSATGGCPAFEIRKYEPAVAAEVHASDMPHITDKEKFTSAAFRTLAKYIGVFSKPENTAAEGVAMTSPVTMQAEPIAMTSPVTMQAEPVAMTSPVTMQAEGKAEGDDYRGVMTFFLPASKYTKASEAPVPTDPLVKLRDVPGRVEAVVQFTWGFKPKNVAQKLKDLRRAIEKAQEGDASFEVVGSSHTASGYNAPFCIPFLRTNEVAVPVKMLVAPEPAAPSA